MTTSEKYAHRQMRRLRAACRREFAAWKAVFGTPEETSAWERYNAAIDRYYSALPH